MGIQSLLDIARAEIGTVEQGNNNIKYNTWYYGHVVNGNNYPYCAVFASWCANKAGIPESIIPRTASAGYFAYYAKQGHGKVFAGNDAQPGDLFLIGYDGNDYADHVGFVESCSGGNIKTIEGNSNNMVRSRTLSTQGLTFVRFPLSGDNAEGTYSANWVERVVPNIGRNLATKAYMAYQLYTDSTSGGYSFLWGNNSSTAKGGLRKYKDFLCMALGSYYGTDGTFVKIEFDDGKVIYGVKADEKKDSETDSNHMYHDYPFDRNVTEFIVDSNVVTGNDSFTAALQAVGISRPSRVKRIWTSDTEPSRGNAGTIEGEIKEYHFADTNEKIPIHARIFNQLPMRPTGSLYALANGQDISRYIGGISWTNTRASLATVFNFSVPKADGMRYINMYTPQLGDIFRYSGGGINEDFRGIVWDVDDSDSKINKYTAVDIGFYLNETTDTYQFTAMRADECLKKICTDLCIPVVAMPELPVLITQIYVDKPVSDVVNDIIARCGNAYNYDFVPEGIRFYDCRTMAASPKFRIASNTELKDSVQFMGGLRHKKSLDGVRNSVKAITETDVVTTLKDNDSIEEYGFLQEVVKISDGEDAGTVAKQKLDELKQLAENAGGTIIEEMDSYTRAGYSITIGGVKYVITSSQHSVSGGVHYNQIDLEAIA